MALKPGEYRPRLVDAKIAKLLEVFGAVQIDGAKGCGKTWSGLAHANSVVSLDDYRVRPLAQADPTVALVGDQPHLIDEWQIAPHRPRCGAPCCRPSCQSSRSIPPNRFQRTAARAV
ncbi:aaa superfamily atpase [Bifidobacterium bohemicum DSM 22767]|uniref:Aaa superfamily atpase n=1 Tax=Bifidobacterium bohemicum DSM 22767 TaxID=1437606 RepID=A0A086ZH75_9BIFI|nr:aaa superfamily atpase [Bifidobacterium bohemicum DSM 22767]